MTRELEKNLPRPIKEVIAEFPALLTILNDYDIGCGSCLVGTCLLQDIVSVHGLPPEQERELMARIAGLLAAGGQAESPAAAPPPRPKEARTYSPPLKKLVDEHVLIKEWLALIPEVIVRLDLSSPEGKKIVSDGLDFIRSYADRFHHGKEEEILFKYFAAGTEIIQAMQSDHETGRGHVRAIREALERGDGQTICTHLQAYRELLLEHIKKEDEILFPWMDRNLSVADKDRLTSQFATAAEEMESELGSDLPARYTKLIADLEQKITVS